jgi:hypothetical protein
VAAFDAPVKHLCEERFGQYECITRLNEAEINTFDTAERRFRTWAHGKHPKKHGQYDRLWSKLAVMYFGAPAGAAGGSSDEREGYVAVLLYAEFGHPPFFIFLVNRMMPPSPGDTIHMDLTVENLCTHTELVKLMSTLSSRPVGYVTLHVNYRQVGLLDYAVESFEDMDALLEHVAKERVAAREMRKLEKLAKGDLPQLRKPRQRAGAKGKAKGKAKSKSKATQPKKKLEGGDDDGDAADSDDGNASSSGSSSSPSSGTKSTGSTSSSSSVLDVDDVAPAPPEPPPPPPALASSSSSSSPPAAPLGGRSLLFDERSGRVTLPSGAYVGRISVVHPGTRAEALSVYCSRHGCSICKRVTAKLPGHNEVLQWLFDGLALPKGKEYQTRHKSTWP